MRGKDQRESKARQSKMSYESVNVEWDNCILFGGSDMGELCHKKEKLIIFKIYN